MHVMYMYIIIIFTCTCACIFVGGNELIFANILYICKKATSAKTMLYVYV